MDYDNKNIIIEPQKAIVTNQFSKKNNNLAIISLIFGIISLVLCWAFIYPVITGLIGIIVGFVSIVEKRDSLNIAIAGTVISVIGLLLGIILSILYIIGIVMN